MNISASFQRILWVDCIGAIATGIVLLIFSGWIGKLYGLPQWFVVAHAFVHLAYGSYSLSLAVRSPRQIALISLLVFANAAWALFCLVFAAVIFRTATIFGVAHFVIEGIYVGTLAIIEWRQRHQLTAA